MQASTPNSAESMRHSLDLKIPPLVLALAMAALMGLLAHAWPTLGLRLPARAVLASLALLAGAGIAVAAIVAFRRAHTTVSPLAPERSSALVAGGVYRFSRNPMYLGVTLILLGWAIWLANALAIASVAAFVAWINRFQITPEEKALAQRFGADFAAYRASTRRWL